MKNDRQTILLEIIEQEAVETQEQLLHRLAERGVKCTQATVSRDIKQLHLVKEPTGQGRYRYAVSVQKSKLNFAEKLRTIFRESGGAENDRGHGTGRRLHTGQHGRHGHRGHTGR